MDKSIQWNYVQTKFRSFGARLKCARLIALVGASSRDCCDATESERSCHSMITLPTTKGSHSWGATMAKAEPRCNTFSN